MERRATRRIAASAEDSWVARATAEGLVRWYVDRSAGHAELGGTLIWARGTFGLEVPLTVKVTDAPPRLAMYAENGVRIEVTIAPAHSGGCDVTVPQTGGLPEDPAGACIVQVFRSGWRLSLAI